MLTCAFSSDDAKLYRLPEFGKTECFIATTPLTREICNNTSVAGVEYTDKLQQACAAVLKLLPVALNEKESVVVNILRGGLNFGLRNALQQAFGWNEHTTCFISAQRARNSSDSEEWHITENAYRKIYFPPVSSLIIGDVVATGTSLRYALNEMIEAAKKSNTRLRDVVFFTYGGR